MQAYDLAETVAWGSVAGSLLQFGVQLPSVIRLAGRIRFQLDAVSANVKTVIRNFIPGVAGRGVNQLSSYIDVTLASLLSAEGAVAALAYTQTIYLLPVSLFGMSISNAELPEMASQAGSQETIAAALREQAAQRQAARHFFHHSFDGRVSGARRQHRRAAVSNGQIHARQCRVRMGGPGGIHRRAAGRDIGTPVHIRLLGIARHTHASSVRQHPCGAGCGIGVVPGFPGLAGGSVSPRTWAWSD